MKKILLVVLIFVVSSCKHSVGNQLVSAIEKYQKGDEHFEHFAIDSLKFSLGNMQNYFYAQIDQNHQYIYERKVLLANSRDIHAYSLIASLSHEINYYDHENSFLLAYTSKLDSVPQVYNVDYHLSYQTDKFNFDGHKTAYLYATNLKPVYVNIDSLYARSKNPVSETYDSTADIQLLKTNDSLENQVSVLTTALELKIAGGTDELSILKQRLVISKIEETISSNKLKHAELYDK